jgi:hypothetical protein
MKRVTKGGRTYLVREDKLIEIVTASSGVAKKQRRKIFEPRFVKFPRHWASALARSDSPNTYRLAHLILFESCKQQTRRVTLSSDMTGWMPRNTKTRAARELAELGLITIEQDGVKALKATIAPPFYY